MDSEKFFSNKKCKYFPCHKTDNAENFNCMFCYCPLYALGENCGGNYTYTKSGIKNCENCDIPHTENGILHIEKKLSEILNLAKKSTENG